MTKKKNTRKIWTLFWIFLFLIVIISFIHNSLGISHLIWNLFLHIGIIFFSFLVLIHSLKLNEKASNYIIFGSLIWILINSILFLSNIFEEYYWLQTNLFIFLGIFAGAFLLIKGFMEAVK